MKNRYRYIWSEKRSLINVESHIRQYIEQRQIFGSTHSHSFIYAKNGFAEELHRKEDNLKWIKLGEKLFHRKFVIKLVKRGRNLIHDFHSFINKLHRTNLSLCNDSELKKLFIESYKFHSKFRAYFKTSREEFLTAAEVELKKLIEEKFAKSRDKNKIFEILTSPYTMDDVNLELLDRAILIKRFHGKIINNQVLMGHLLKYPWLVAHSHNLSSILLHLKSMVREVLSDKKKIDQKIKKLKSTKNKLKAQQVKFLSTVKSKKLSYLSWLFQTMSLERMRLKGSWSGSDFLYLPIYTEISKRTGIALKDLCSVYRINEAVKAINSKKDCLSASEKKRRKKCYVLWLKNNKLLFYSGKDALSVIQNQVEILSPQKELKGQPASAGYATGKAQIVIPGDIKMLNKALKKFKKGHVLITTMTQPNMVPIMAKSSAIVTDEGGLTSHAAIIARELKVPCIVGTRIATKIFKDGDLIEVNANKNTVSKLS